MTYKSIMLIYNTGDYMKRNVNYLDMTCYLFPRPFGERVRERGYLAASLLSRLTAFTLAEVLITLGIIGIVAAMTMPSLIQNYQEKATVTRVKKEKTISVKIFFFMFPILLIFPLATWGDKGNRRAVRCV